MPDDPPDLSLLVERHQAGDPAAREHLIAAACGRLERLARKMLRGFPGVGRWEDTADVLQNALIRLDRALRAVAPSSSREFIGLAAEQIRRELLDLARRHRGPHGHGRNHESGMNVGDAARDGLDPPAADPDAGELERWAALHEAVEKLPPAEREVFVLTFYHKWSQAQIAELFQVDERTVRRRWKAAAELLHDALGGDLPGS
jgi:RNA polymerase sigma-70 factor (ECF subfamily)